jgi:hypothetical protein
MTQLRSTNLIMLTAAAAMLLVSGCSQKSAGEASPQSSPGTAEGTTTTTSSASSTGPELSVTKFASNPCGLLKADQLAQLGTFKAPETSDNPLGNKCRWAAQDILKGAAYSVIVGTKGQTFDEVAKNSQGVKVYRATTVGGYQAVSSDATDGKGNCTTAVGTSSKDVFVVQISIENENAPEHADSCAATEKVAALVVQNLKG